MSTSPNFSSTAVRPYKLLEFYCGIGGVRYAIESVSIPYVSVGAVDISHVMNEIHCHNFETNKFFQRNIQSFKAEEIDEIDPDIVTMTPPCQPFTRTGLRLGVRDPRSQSFLHLLDVYYKLKRKPSYFFLENVAGFETTPAREALIKTMSDCGYIYQEFLLSPTQCGIPNSRKRYYLIAKQHFLKFIFPISEQILCDWPVCKSFVAKFYLCERCHCENFDSPSPIRCTVKHFLEEQPSHFFESFLLSETVLSKYGLILDIVNEDSQNSMCFTRGYRKYVLGTGSVLHPMNAPQIDEIYKEANVCDSNNMDKGVILKKLKLRYFTPREVANLMCFPSTLRFPDHITMEQKYKALGNSVNVFVVSQLILLMILEK